jgi:hypothetical protein
VSARDARGGSARDRSAAAKNRPGNPRRAPQAAPRRASAATPAGRGRGRLPARAPVDQVVLGPVPVQARVVGGLLVLAALAAVAGLFPTYLVVGGTELSLATGVGSTLVGLLVPVAALLVGASLLRGMVPKLGLAYAAVSATLAVGQLLIELYRGSSSTTRPGVEVIAGQRVITSSVEVRAGWVLGVAALALTVLAGLGAAAVWSRVVMEDGGALDPARSGLAGAAVLVGVGTVLCLSQPAADVPDQLVPDPSTGLVNVVTQEGPQALLERPGLALLGGLLLAGALLLCSVVVPSVRPRLAAVGGLLALAVVVLAAGLSGWRDAVASKELDWTLPGIGLVLAGLAYAGLTVVAWRVRRRPAAVPDEDEAFPR